MIYTLGKHMQVLIESPESIVRRETKPRARRRYLLMCSCRGHRYANGHCQHTAALLQDQVKPERWKDVTPSSMTSIEKPSGPPERSTLDLEREIVELRKRLDGIGGQQT